MRMIWSVATAALVVAGCGGSDDGDTVAEEPVGPRLAVVDSGARWVLADPMADTPSMEEFDVTQFTTDPDVLGIEIWWEIEELVEGFGPKIATVGFAMEGEAISESAIRAGTDRRVEEAPLTFDTSTSDGRITYFLEPRGASDLVDENGEPTVLVDFTIDLDLDGGSAGLSDVQFLADTGVIGEIDYDLVLSIDGFGMAPSTVSFTTTESDPDAEFVVAEEVEEVEEEAGGAADSDEAGDSDEAAGDDAEVGCPDSGIEVEGGSVRIPGLFGESVFVGALPAGWSASIEVAEVECGLPTVVVDPAIEGASVRLRMVELTQLPSTSAEEWAAMLGGEIVEPVTDVDIWGSFGAQITVSRVETGGVVTGLFVEFVDGVLEVIIEAPTAADSVGLVEALAPAGSIEFG